MNDQHKPATRIQERDKPRGTMYALGNAAILAMGGATLACIFAGVAAVIF